MQPLRIAPPPEFHNVAMQAANMATPLTRQRRLLATKVILSAGPARDGFTPNSDLIWLVGRGGTAAEGQPLYPGDTLELNHEELGGLIDLSQWYFIGAVATDVLRVTWWPASDEILAALSAAGDA